MADGFHIEISDALAERLAKGARAAGMGEAEFARHLLEQQLFSWSDYAFDAEVDADPAIDEAIADETDRRGDGIPWETFKSRLDAFGRRDG